MWPPHQVSHGSCLHHIRSASCRWAQVQQLCDHWCQESMDVTHLPTAGWCWRPFEDRLDLQAELICEFRELSRRYLINHANWDQVRTELFSYSSTECERNINFSTPSPAECWGCYQSCQLSHINVMIHVFTMFMCPGPSVFLSERWSAFTCSTRGAAHSWSLTAGDTFHNVTVETVWQNCDTKWQEPVWISMTLLWVSWLLLRLPMCCCLCLLMHVSWNLCFIHSAVISGWKCSSVLFLLPSQNPDPNTHTVLLCKYSNNYNIIVYL